MEAFLGLLVSLIPLLATVVGVVLFLLTANWMLLVRHPEFDNAQKLPRQLVMLGFTIAGVVAIAISLPVSDSVQNQVIALIGISLSAVIAMSSTTIVANLMAGIILRMTQAFKTGDFIRVGDHFGRVADRGLFDTEIQTEQRELVSLSNSFLIAHPVAVVRSSGTIVSGTLSLGYDVEHRRVESLLVEAAQAAGLEEPFVLIVELGNYAITYRISGLLTEVKSLLTARSNLYRHVLDTLHRDGVEIVSPTFMNQRRMDEQVRIIPEAIGADTAPDNARPEDIVFDKAEESEQRENAKSQLEGELHALEAKLKAATGDDRQQLVDAIARRKEQIVELTKATEGQSSD